MVSQFLLLIQPLLVTVVDKNSINRYINLLEDPAAVESLIDRIERKAKGDGYPIGFGAPFVLVGNLVVVSVGLSSAENASNAAY